MTTKKPRKSRPGDAWKEMQRAADIRRQKDDERARHTSAISDLRLRRAKAVLMNNSDKRAIELERIHLKEFDEHRRHQAKMDALTKRIFRKP
jgi:hypothetical protein